MRTRREIIAQAAAALTASFAGRLAAQASAQAATATTSCVLTPVTGEGPFYFDPKLVRSDITENQPGAPLTLDMRIVSADSCKPIPKVRVDLWHADATGVYSGYENQDGNGSSGDRNAKGKTFLRGTQFTNADGLVTFRTIYPSWYRGRTPHLHYKVLLEPREVAVSQLYFPDKVSERLYTSSKAYVPRKAGRDTFNEGDMFLRGGHTGGAFCNVVSNGSGANSNYRASVVIGIAGQIV
jgi:protocatechuate 3,4-dioxygenase beta subunit